MLVTFLENVIVHVRSPSHSFQISWASLNKGRASDCVFLSILVDSSQRFSVPPVAFEATVLLLKLFGGGAAH